MNRRLASWLGACLTCVGIGMLMMFAVLEVATARGGWHGHDGHIYEIFRVGCAPDYPNCRLGAPKHWAGK